MLPTYVALHDIDDAEGFVAATIQRTGLRLGDTEHEELLAEGICILFELANRYEPQRTGYSAAGRFSGFAAQFLPRRLGDAWHRQHPEHHRIAGEDGKRTWHYEPAPISLDSLLSTDGGANQADHVRSTVEVSIRPPAQWAQASARPAGDRTGTLD